MLPIQNFQEPCNKNNHVGQFLKIRNLKGAGLLYLMLTDTHLLIAYTTTNQKETVLIKSGSSEHIFNNHLYDQYRTNWIMDHVC